MRVKVTFKGPGGFFVPFNYNHVLASIIYNKVNDKRLHDSCSYKYFTFSNLVFDDYRVFNRGIVSFGSFSFLISSHDSCFIDSLVSGFMDDFGVYFQGCLLKVVDVEVIRNPRFGCVECFRSLSPILCNSLRNINGVVKTWDLAPSGEFLRILESNLVDKYLAYYGLDGTDKRVKISFVDDDFVSKRISIKKGRSRTFNRAYFVNLKIDGDAGLIDFAYDVGLGVKNSMGFGMIEKMEKSYS